MDKRSGPQWRPGPKKTDKAGLSSVMNCFSYADQFSRIAIEARREKCELRRPTSRFQTVPEEFPIIEIRTSVCGISSSESLAPTGNLGPAFEPVIRCQTRSF